MIQREPDFGYTYEKPRRPLEDEFRPIEWGTPPPRKSGGRNPAITKIIEDAVADLMTRPGEWAKVRFGVSKGRAACRPFEQRGCLTQLEAVGPSPGEDQLYDVWGMWPFLAHDDGTFEKFLPPD